jgi:hypothetical protein
MIYVGCARGGHDPRYFDYAAWTVDNARLAVLDAIEARGYADELAKAANS